jgi:endoglucanase
MRRLMGRAGPRPLPASSAVAGVLIVVASLLLVALAGVRGPGADPVAIRVNQLGYRPGDPKVALIAAAPATFAVREAAGGRIVFEAPAGPPAPADPASGDRVAALDFSRLTTPGEYVVTAPGVGASPPFRVGDGIYADALRTVLKSYAYQRCGTAIRDGSPFAHPACHLEDAREWPSGPRRDVTGGWHDAGDYGKYVPAAGITLWHLAAVHDLSAGSGLADELRWELDWLTRMQASDGGVHHKVGPARWTADRAPHEDRDPRYLFAVSSTATANLAAIGARAARLFAPHDRAYAARLLTAAEAAWRWLEQHPALVPAGGFANPPGVEGGAYEDDDDRDERFWAAVELWRATGGGKYRTAALAALDRWPPFDYPASWRRVQNLAYLSLLERESPLDAPARARLRAALVERSGWEADAVRQGGYRVALTPQDYYWGSNGLALGRAVQLLAAFRETGREELRQTALDQLHYVFGRNTLGKSFVTGLGADPPRRPYYQPAIAHPARRVVPGMLVGGPNAQAEGLTSGLPARAYRDEDRLYGVNEPGIYWTAVLAHVLAALSR